MVLNLQLGIRKNIVPMHVTLMSGYGINLKGNAPRVKRNTNQKDTFKSIVQGLVIHTKSIKKMSFIKVRSGKK